MKNNSERNNISDIINTINSNIKFTELEGIDVTKKFQRR
jgi:hypothetical protein